ncbi:hypothetical protein D9M69_602450 [compost metagenome]
MAGTSGEYGDGEHQQSGDHRFHFWRPGDWVRGNEHRLPAPPGQQKSTLSIVAIKKWRSLPLSAPAHQAAVQCIVVAALQAVQDLERAEGHGLRLMGADQLPEILFAAFKGPERSLPGFAGLPLQIIEYPPAIIAGLDAGTEKAAVLPGQMFGLRRQCQYQRGLLMRLDLEFDQLSKAAIVL